MPGILPPRLITTKIGTSAQSRIAQACDRCRSKKIRCDGVRPSCTQCLNVGFECKTSDKLSRRAFPRGYTESLEERVRGLEAELRELKDVLDLKDEKIDILSRMHGFHQPASRRPSAAKFTPPPSLNGSDAGSPTNEMLKIEQMPYLLDVDGSDSLFMGSSSARAMVDSFQRKMQEQGRTADMRLDLLLPQQPFSKLPASPPSPQAGQLQAPPRVVSDQMVNVFFQEWAPLFPILHRPSFLAVYENYTSSNGASNDHKALAQLHLVFCIAGISSETDTPYDIQQCERQWMNALSTFSMESSLVTVQCLILAQIYCMQKGDYTRMLHYRSLAVGTCHRLGLQQAQKRFALNVLTCETRKKTFWALYTVDCYVSAVLGLPRLIHDSDVDCEYPVDADDESISEQGFQPSLPGESTKISGALALFRGVRILGKVLRQSFPTRSSYEVPTVAVAALEAELEEWSSSLPSHLQLTFDQGKPSTNVISSRCPLLALTYHFTRALIHRPVAFSTRGEKSSLSVMALFTSSKHIVQILELLEERNLSFSMCLNKNELAMLCGFASLLQAVELHPDSKLLQDVRKSTSSVTNMLAKRQAAGAGEFKRVASAALGTSRLAVQPRPMPSRDAVGDTPTSTESHGSAASQLEGLASRYRAAVSGTTSSESPSVRSSSMQTMSTTLPPPAPSPASVQSPVKRFRPIAPSSSLMPQSPRTLSFSRHSEASPVQVRHASREATVGCQAPGGLNLDYFAFPFEDASAAAAVPPAAPPITAADAAGSWAASGSRLTPQSQHESDIFSWPSMSDSLNHEDVIHEGQQNKVSRNSYSGTPGRSHMDASLANQLGLADEAFADCGSDFEGFDFSSLEADAALFALESVDGSPDSFGSVARSE